MFRRRFFALLLSVAAALSASAQHTPQTARQALIDMIRKGNLLDHLPDATRAAIEKSGSTASLSMPAFQLQAMSKNIQVFPAGSVLLTLAQPGGDKFQVNVERDDLSGDRDEMELSIHGFKNGQEQALGGITPRLALGMVLERGTWRIQQVGLNLGIKLDDPEFLKSLQRNAAQRTGNSDEISAISTVRQILDAEQAFKLQNPARGYTCSLPGLAAVAYRGTATRMLPPELGSGQVNNYSYTLSGCGSPPSPSFQVLAVPGQPGRRAFCADQTGQIKSTAADQAAACMIAGAPLSGRSSAVVAPK
jgi:hypothetical protein